MRKFTEAIQGCSFVFLVLAVVFLGLLVSILALPFRYVFGLCQDLRIWHKQKSICRRYTGQQVALLKALWEKEKECRLYRMQYESGLYERMQVHREALMQAKSLIANCRGSGIADTDIQFFLVSMYR